MKIYFANALFSQADINYNIGLYTDTRQQGAGNQQKLDALSQVAENQFHYVNLYTTGLIKLNGTIVNNEADLLTAIKQKLN